IGTGCVVGVRRWDGKTLGYCGASILVGRIGRRLSAITFVDRAICQIIDQRGFPLFTPDFKANTEPSTGGETKLISEIRKEQNGNVTRNGTIYSFDPLETANPLAIVSQSEPLAPEPLHTLL